MRSTRRSFFGLAIACAALPFGIALAQEDVTKRLVGTWRLVTYKNAAGQDDPVRGPHPTGLLMYDGLGNMAVQITPDRDRPKYALNKATPEQAQEALLGYVAYFGTYSVDQAAGTVTHHRRGNINPGGMGDFVRRFELVGDDRLILRPLDTGSQLTWERVK